MKWSHFVPNLKHLFIGQKTTQNLLHQRETETDTDRHRQTRTDGDRRRQTETDRDRQRLAETERDRQRQTEADTETETFMNPLCLQILHLGRINSKHYHGQVGRGGN